jgi:hypothetical protein
LSAFYPFARRTRPADIYEYATDGVKVEGAEEGDCNTNDLWCFITRMTALAMNPTILFYSFFRLGGGGATLAIKVFAIFLSFPGAQKVRLRLDFLRHGLSPMTPPLL